MTGVQITWWRAAEMDVLFSLYPEAPDLAAMVVTAGIAVLWMTRQPRAFWPALGWGITACGVCAAGNALTLTGFWMLNTVSALALFRWSTEGGKRGLYVFALGSAMADMALLLGYLFYSGNYRDSFLPSEEAYREASAAMSLFPVKLFGSAVVAAAATRLGLGAASLWLPGEPRLEARELLGQRLPSLALPGLMLMHKLSFLRTDLPCTTALLAAISVPPALAGAVLHAFGKSPHQWLNPARWFEELVEKPLKSAITFLDRRIEVRTVDALLLLPSRLARAGGVWISLLQSGSLTSYLTLAALGMALVLVWALWGTFG